MAWFGCLLHALRYPNGQIKLHCVCVPIPHGQHTECPELLGWRRITCIFPQHLPQKCLPKFIIKINVQKRVLWVSVRAVVGVFNCFDDHRGERQPPPGCVMCRTHWAESAVPQTSPAEIMNAPRAPVTHPPPTHLASLPGGAALDKNWGLLRNFIKVVYIQFLSWLVYVCQSALETCWKSVNELVFCTVITRQGSLGWVCMMNGRFWIKRLVGCSIWSSLYLNLTYMAPYPHYLIICMVSDLHDPFISDQDKFDANFF